MLKKGKLFSVLSVFIMLLLMTTPVFATSGPSHANDKVTFCHATPPATAANGYNQVTVDEDAVIREGHDGHGADIIPAFWYWEKRGQNWTFKHFDGKNLDKIGILNNGCKVVTPTPPTPTPPTVTPTTETPTVEPTTETPTVEPTTPTVEPTTATPEPTTATPTEETETPTVEPTTPTVEPTPPTVEPTTATPEPTTATPTEETETPTVEPTTATPEPTTETATATEETVTATATGTPEPPAPPVVEEKASTPAIEYCYYIPVPVDPWYGPVDAQMFVRSFPLASKCDEYGCGTITSLGYTVESPLPFILRTAKLGDIKVEVTDTVAGKYAHYENSFDVTGDFEVLTINGQKWTTVNGPTTHLKDRPLTPYDFSPDGKLTNYTTGWPYESLVARGLMQFFPSSYPDTAEGKDAAAAKAAEIVKLKADSAPISIP